MTTHPDLQAEIDRLRRENASLKDAALSRHKIKISDKGCVSLYGLGRFPVSLYRGQWQKLVPLMSMVMEFIDRHSDELDAFDEDK